MSVRSIGLVGTAVRPNNKKGGRMEFESWLKALADGGGSDLYLTAGVRLPALSLMVSCVR